MYQSNETIFCPSGGICGFSFIHSLFLKDKVVIYHFREIFLSKFTWKYLEGHFLCIFVIYRYKKVFLKYLKSEKNGMFVFPCICIVFHIFVCRIFSHAVLLILHKKSSFPLRLSSVNATKSAVSCGFGRIY